MLHSHAATAASIRIRNWLIWKFLINKNWFCSPSLSLILKPASNQKSKIINYNLFYIMKYIKVGGYATPQMAMTTANTTGRTIIIKMPIISFPNTYNLLTGAKTKI